MTERYTLVVGINDDQKPDMDRALRTFSNPMEAMSYITLQTIVEGGYLFAWAECWRWEDGMRKERQWRLEID